MSVHVGIAHVIMALQYVLKHSPLTMQPWPFMQSFGHIPPQSTSVSLPFCAMSMHVGAAQVIMALQ
jgi:hypothetical protein